MKKLFINILIPLYIIFLSFYLPIFNFPFDTSSLITAVSLLFTILVGFFIAATTSNYLRLQSLSSQEDSSLINIFHLCKLISPKSDKDIAEKIDQYAINMQSFEMTEYVEKCQPKFDKLVESIDNVEATNKKGESLIQTLHTIKLNLASVRQEINVVSKPIIKTRHWIILILLSIITMVLVLCLRVPDSLPSSMITGSLGVAIYFVLILVREIDNKTFSEEQMSFQNPQQIFETIGKPYYYMEYIIKNKRVADLQLPCRIGRIVNNEIKIIKKID